MLQLSGLDGMRFLGIDKSGRPDEVEVALMVAVQKRLVREQEKAANAQR